MIYLKQKTFHKKVIRKEIKFADLIWDYVFSLPRLKQSIVSEALIFQKITL